VRPPVRPGARRGPIAGAPFLAAAFLAAAFLAACGSSTVSPGESDGSTPTASAAPASVEPSTPPVPTPTAAPSDPGPTATATAAPVSSPSSSAPAAACAGNDDNRDFYASFAEAVEWDVYCPSLPDGWFVETGTYRLSGGAWMEITYRGPAGAHFGLREGAFCREEGSDCVPPGTDVGAAAFGNRQGTLVAADDGTWAITVDRGLNPAWLATGSGIDEAAFRAHAEALTLVGR
jgi:hypothetical protein